MKFYRGPWVWNDTEKSWNPPDGFTGLDLRNITDQSSQGGTPGIGLFFGKGNLPSEYDLLGSGAHRDVKTSARLRNLVPCRKGYAPKGNDLLGLVWDTLTDGADPDGDDFAKPIMPGTDGRLSLHCGQSHHERFRWGNQNVKAVIRKDFARLFKDAGEGKLKDRFQHLRVLDFWCEQFGLNGPEDWKELVPNALHKDVPGRMRHETTYQDTFDRADSSGLGTSSGGQTWSNVSFSWNVVSNKAHAGSNGALSRLDADLSSADHYAQADFETTSDAFVGPAVRFSSSGATLYVGYSRNTLGGVSGTNRIVKIVAGTTTSLSQTNTGGAFASGTIQTEVNGSSLTQYRDASITVGPITDTSITGNLRTGLKEAGPFSATDVKADNFEAADLGGGGGGIVYTQLERSVRGYRRGTWTGGV